MASSTKTILVVDDEEAARGLISTVLRRDGFVVLEARDFQTATNLHQRHRGKIDLLLTDVSLPGRNGCELAEMLRQDEPSLEVLFMSGLSGAEVCRFNGVPAEGWHFLQKPFGLAELLKRIHHFFERSEGAAGSAPA